MSDALRGPSSLDLLFSFTVADSLDWAIFHSPLTWTEAPLEVFSCQVSDALRGPSSLDLLFSFTVPVEGSLGWAIFRSPLTWTTVLLGVFWLARTRSNLGRTNTALEKTVDQQIPTVTNIRKVPTDVSTR